MSYKKRPEIDTHVRGESVVELDTGDLVAVAAVHRRSDVTQAPIFEVSARWLDPEGLTRRDAHGLEVAVHHLHHSSHDEVERHTLPAVLRACLCLVLGEPAEVHEVDGEAFPRVPFSAEVTAQQSIRNAIVAAKRTFEVVDTASLL